MSREVLSPPLLRMGPNRCYRVNLVHEDFGGNSLLQQPEKQEYVEKDMYEDDDDEDDAERDIEVLPNASFKLSIHIASAFYGGLIGLKGSTKRRIETETQTDIFVPRSRDIGGNRSGKAELVTITGKTRSNVCAARRKINLLISSLRKRLRPTHFVCVPVNFSEVKANYLEFKKQILEANLPGIDESLFQTEACIHLTLTTCMLMDDIERAKGVELLQNCREFLTERKTPFDITLKGLEIMNDDPSAVRVLYGRVEAPELQQFANKVHKFFVQSGLAFNEYERKNVKLHMTVMNNRSRMNVNTQAPRSFDAREILKRYSDYNFGSIQCNEVQLCVIRAPNDTRDYYKITGVLKF